MNAAAQLTQAAMSVAGRSTAQFSLDPDQAQDLYAIWKSIFERTELIEAAVPAPPQVREPQHALQFVASCSSDVPEAGSRAPLQSTAEVMRPMPVEAASAKSINAESVNVFVQGAAVSIVVRDTAIDEHEAVRCAFETAHKLTGQRTALQHLTLNGRILYQQQSDSRTHESPPLSALVFAC